MLFKVVYEFLTRCAGRQTRFRVSGCRNERCMCRTFFITYINDAGDLTVEHVQANKLIFERGRIYVSGWCQTAPIYKRLAVDRIAELADDRAGEFVPRQDVADWLKRHSKGGTG